MTPTPPRLVIDWLAWKGEPWWKRAMAEADRPRVLAAIDAHPRRVAERALKPESVLPRRGNTWRDRLAHRLANAALKIASPYYRNFIGGSIRYGLQAAAIDEALAALTDGGERESE